MSGAADVDAKIATLADWRGETLSRLRAVILAADPDVTESIKWRKPANPSGVPVWEGGGGMICTGETYKDKVKLTFARGAALDDPTGLFNAPGTGNTRRAMDVKEGETVDGKALQALVRGAIALNGSKAPRR